MGERVPPWEARGFPSPATQTPLPTLQARPRPQPTGHCQPGRDTGMVTESPGHHSSSGTGSRGRTVDAWTQDKQARGRDRRGLGGTRVADWRGVTCQGHGQGQQEPGQQQLQERRRSRFPGTSAAPGRGPTPDSQHRLPSPTEGAGPTAAHSMWRTASWPKSRAQMGRVPPHSYTLHSSHTCVHNAHTHTPHAHTLIHPYTPHVCTLTHTSPTHTHQMHTRMHTHHTHMHIHHSHTTHVCTHTTCTHTTHMHTHYMHTYTTCTRHMHACTPQAHDTCTHTTRTHAGSPVTTGPFPDCCHCGVMEPHQTPR